MSNTPAIEDEPAPKPSGKRRLLLILAGLLAGSGGAAGAYAAMGARVEVVTPPKPAEIMYVDVGRMMVPLVDPNGDLVGYVAIEARMELLAENQAEVRDRLPVLQHEINMRSWKTGLAAGPDHMLLGTDNAMRLYKEAAAKAFGKHVVRRILLTSVTPA